MTINIGTNSAASNPFFDIGLGSADKKKASKNELDQAAFLRLMTEQLKNQDPLKPLGSQEFLGQMAQFSTVQGINSLNTTFKGVAAGLFESQALGTVHLVGKDALIVSDRFQLGEEGGLESELGVPMAGKVTVEITDASGGVVHKEVIEAKKGYQPFSWDGRSLGGERMPVGEYRIRATVEAGTQKDDVLPIVQSRIESVSFSSQGVALNAAGIGAVPLSNVHRIK